MGGKGYKSYTSLTGKKVSGDWEDSDRGAGNRATRRSGGKVKAKSPTYLAHVHNKGKKKVDPEKNPAVKEHHQVDANGKVVEHGDGTPSSVEEAKKKGLDGKECWDGYKLAGTKKKGGKTVDNCVKSEGYKGTADLSKADPDAKKKLEDRIAKHVGTKRVPGGKMGVKEDKLAESDVPRNSMGKPIRIKDKIKAAKGFIPHKGKPTNENFIGEVNTENENPNSNEKKIDVMKGKNKIKINPNVGEQVEPNTKVDPSIEKKQQRVSMMKRQILQKKMQAVRSGGGADIVAHNEPKGGMAELNEISKKLAVKADYVRKKREFDAAEDRNEKQMDKQLTKSGKFKSDENRKRILKKHGDGAKEDLAKNTYKAHFEQNKVEQEDPRSMGTKYRNIKNKLRSMGVKFVGPASRLEEEDKAFNYVLSKLKKKHGDGVLTKRDKIKPQSAADKAKARAHQSKVDAENAAASAKDPAQGRYPKG